MTPNLQTIFDVLDNFTGSQDCPGEELLSDGNIEKLRQDVLRFYADFHSQPPKEYETRFYLGGFLSSPPLTREMAPYVASALLCSDSIILYDPLHFWFCEEQYKRERLLSAPNGWLNIKTKDPDHPRTRQYLSKIFDFFYSLRPLVEAGIVILIPAEKIVHESLTSLSDCQRKVADDLGELELVADRFSPEEITVDDNRKGMFAFAGGNRTEQIRKSIGRGLEQFAKDVLIAARTDSVYVAPFAWEQHLAKETLQGFALDAPQSKVVEGIRNLRLPLLANLTPDSVLRIHQDSEFSAFRLGLSDAFRSIHADVGTASFAGRVDEIERSLLIPKVEKIHQEIRSSKFLRRAAEATNNTCFVFVSTYASVLVTGAGPLTSVYPSAVTAGAAFLRKVFKKRAARGEHRIWAELLPENPTLAMYGNPAVLNKIPEKIVNVGPAAPGSPAVPNTGGTRGWNIDKEPSMSVRFSAGVAKLV